MIRLLLSLALAAAAPQDPPQLSELVGLWTTPGGNIIEVTRSDGRFEGRLVEVTVAAAASGFQRGDVALRSFAEGDDGVSFEVAVRGDDPSFPVGYARFRGGVFRGEALSGELERGDYDADARRYEPQPGWDGFEYHRVSLRCPLPVESPASYRVSLAGEAEVSLRASSDEPLGAGEPRLAVRVTTLAGVAVPKEEVEWTVRTEGLSATYRTVTDHAGEAELKLGLLPNGSFAPINTLEAPRVTIPLGAYTIEATVPRESLDTARIALRLSTLPILLFVDASGQPLSGITFGDDEEERNVYVTVFDPEAGAQRPTALTISTPGLWPYRHVLPRQGEGSYHDAYAYVIERPSEPVVEITATAEEIPGVYAVLKVYRHDQAAAMDVARSLLGHFRLILNDPELWAAADDGNRRRIMQKRWFAEAGLTALDGPMTMRAEGTEEALRPPLRLALADAYLQMIQNPAELSGFEATPRTRPVTFTAAFGTRFDVPVQVRATQEWARLGAALRREAQRQDHDAFTGARDLMLERVTRAVAALPGVPAAILQAPGRYAASLIAVIAFDMTLEGGDVDPVDRWFAGLELATLRLSTPPLLDLWKHGARKRRTLEEVREVARRHGLPEDQIQAALYASRYEGVGAAFIQRLLEVPIPDELVAMQLDVLRHTWSYPSVGRLRQRLDDLEVEYGHAAPSGRMRMRLGSLQHLIKLHENRGFFQYLVAQGRAVATPDGGFRHSAGGVVGAVEERFEWTVPGTTRRVDHLMINHDQQTFCVTDLAAQLTDRHRAKTQLYKDLLSERFGPGWRGQAAEFYWDEQAGEMVERVLGAFTTEPPALH